MGPTTKAISVTGGATFEEMIGHYRVQALGLLEGGADLLLLETMQDTRNLKAGLIAVRRAMDETGIEVPVSVSATDRSAAAPCSRARASRPSTPP